MVAIMSGADNGFFYAGQVMHFSSPFTVFLIYHKQIKQGVMALDSDKYTEEDKKKLIVEYLTAFKDFAKNRENSNSEKQKK